MTSLFDATDQLICFMLEFWTSKIAHVCFILKISLVTLMKNLGCTSAVRRKHVYTYKNAKCFNIYSVNRKYVRCQLQLHTTVVWVRPTMTLESSVCVHIPLCLPTTTRMDCVVSERLYTIFAASWLHQCSFADKLLLWRMLTYWRDRCRCRWNIEKCNFATRCYAKRGTCHVCLSHLWSVIKRLT